MSLLGITINYIASHFSHFDRAASLLDLPDTVMDELVDQVMKSKYIPHLSSPALAAEVIDLTACASSEKEKVQWVFNKFKKTVSILIMNGSVFASDDFILGTEPFCKLKKLELLKAPVSSTTIAQLISLLPRDLSVFTLEDAVGVDQDCLDKLGIQCPKLKELSVPKGTFTSIPTSFVNLTKLNIKKSCITKESLKAFAISCPNLLELDIEGCKEITWIPDSFVHKEEMKLANPEIGDDIAVEEISSEDEVEPQDEIIERDDFIDHPDEVVSDLEDLPGDLDRLSFDAED